MAISDTIQSMYENVGEVYDTITNVPLPEHKNIENIPSTIRESYLEIMNNGIDVVWNNWEKVVGEGTDLTLSNTEYAPMKLDLKGNTYQDSTTGKNLLNIPDGTYTDNDNLITAVASNGEITINGTTGSSYAILYIRNVNISVSASYYSLSINNSNTNDNIIIRFDSNVMPTQLNKVNKTNLKNFDSSQTLINFAIRVKENTTVTNFKIKPQFEAGQSATSWEEYTGGIPSPNPDYPQEVHTVSGDNEVEVSNGDNTQSTTYPINLPEGMFLGSIGDYKDRFFKNSGKNIYNPSNLKIGSINTTTGQEETSYYYSISQDFIEVEPSQSYSFQYAYNYSSITGQIVVYQYDTNQSFIRFDASNTKDYNLTLRDNTKYVKCRFKGDTNHNNNVSEYEKMQIAKGTSIPYEPYGSNEWYLEKKIGKVVFDGTIGGFNQSGDWFYLGVANLGISVAESNFKSDYYTWYAYATFAGTSQPVGISMNNTLTNFLIRNSGFSSKNDYTNWLGTNKPIVYYPLSTPTYTKIEGTLASQLEAVYRAKSEEGQTNISQTNNDLPFVLSVSALKEIS